MADFTPRLVAVDDAIAGGRVAARILLEALAEDTAGALGVATGSTPLTTWEALAEQSPRPIDRLLVGLDEYADLPRGHPQSFRRVIERQVADRIGVPYERVIVPEGDDSDAGGREFERLVERSGGVAIQVLGIGRNGHVAFNEPGSSLQSRTRTVRLTDETRSDNARDFGSIDDVPQRAFTQGIGTILSARRLLLLAWGESKSTALRSALTGPIGSRVPASAIRLHPRCTVVADRDALEELRHVEPRA